MSTKQQLARARSQAAMLRKENREALPRTLSGTPAVLLGGLAAALIGNRSLELGPISVSMKLLAGAGSVVGELTGAGDDSYIARGAISTAAGCGAVGIYEMAKDGFDFASGLFGGDDE